MRDVSIRMSKGAILEMASLHNNQFAELAERAEQVPFYGYAYNATYCQMQTFEADVLRAVDHLGGKRLRILEVFAGRGLETEKASRSKVLSGTTSNAFFGADIDYSHAGEPQGIKSKLWTPLTVDVIDWPKEFIRNTSGKFDVIFAGGSTVSHCCVPSVSAMKKHIQGVSELLRRGGIFIYAGFENTGVSTKSFAIDDTLTSYEVVEPFPEFDIQAGDRIDWYQLYRMYRLESLHLYESAIIHKRKGEVVRVAVVPSNYKTGDGLFFAYPYTHILALCKEVGLEYEESLTQNDRQMFFVKR